jgi:predicted nucleotidyltransferase
MTIPGLEVPAINGRKRIPKKVIRNLARQIAEQFKPEKIILFGSYARANPSPESDVDLLVVMDTKLKEVRQSIEICQKIEYMFGVDLIVYTPKHLKERVKMGDWFVRDVLKEGKVLYEAGNR